MRKDKTEDIKEIAEKLSAIYSQLPTDYTYLKLRIHHLLRKKTARRPQADIHRT